MTQKEKQLLLRDLCGRLPYHVRVKVWLKDGDTEEGPLDLQHNYGDVLRDAFYYNKITKIKPYLRPLSSMTEEEKNEIKALGAEFSPIGSIRFRIEEDENDGFEYGYQWLDILDFLNKHHFDYRGLIPMCLALPATDGMYEF